MDNEVPPIQHTPPPLPPQQPPQAPVTVTVRKTGRGWMLLSLLLLGVLGLMLLSKLGSKSTGQQSGMQFHEVLVENNQSDDKIAIIDVTGMITRISFDASGNSMVDFIEDQLKVAGRDDKVKAVILKVDSPGGEVMASDDISRALLQFQEEYDKPVIAAMGGLAASGGYYVSAPCQWIVANELTLTGSIGVIMSTFNYRGLMDKVGLTPQVFKSGRFKDMLRGSKLPSEIDPEETKMIQDIVDETFGKFKKVVVDGRSRANTLNKGEGRKLADNWQEYADGRVLTGTQAYQHGFVDELGNFETAVRAAQRIAGIGEANLIRYQQPFSFLDAFSLFGKSEPPVIKLELTPDALKLEAGRMYFLSPVVAN